MTHEEALLAAEEMLREARRLLRESADLLRGPDIHPSPPVMRLEMAVSRAIDTLEAARLRRGT